MKKPFLIIFMLFSFISVSFAEFSCVCTDDFISHAADQNQIVKKTDHQNASSENSPVEQEHCHHTCNQCHFAAVVPHQFHAQNISSKIITVYFHSQKSPQAVALSLYRPPIA